MLVCFNHAFSWPVRAHVPLDLVSVNPSEDWFFLSGAKLVTVCHRGEFIHFSYGPMQWGKNFCDKRWEAVCRG